MDKLETSNFSKKELECKCCGLGGASVALLVVLEWVKLTFGDLPVIINSCARCVHHNAEVGGSKYSKHIVTPEDPLSDAADIRVIGRHAGLVADVLESCPFKNLIGVGRYNGRTHVDVRGYPARWDMR